MSRLSILENEVIALRAEVRATTPITGQGVNVTDAIGGGGKVITLAPKSQQQAAVERGQLQIYVQNQASGIIGITPGQVAGLAEDGTDTWTVTGNGTIWAQVDVSPSQAFTNLSIFDNGSSPPPIIDSAHAFQLIGNYITSGGVLSAQPMVAGSQGLSICFSDPTTANIIPTWVLI